MPDGVVAAALDAAPAPPVPATATPLASVITWTRARLGPPRAWVGLVVLVFLAFGAVGLHMHTATKMSPLDEMVHTDYAVQASHGHLVRYGQPVGAVAMQEEACRGIDLQGIPLPQCGASLRPEDFDRQLNGFNTAATHPPAYFAITGVMARGLKLVLGIGSFLTAARIVGGLWLAAGVVLLWFLMEELRIGYVARVASAALMVIAPVTLNATAFVNNDGSAFVCGAGTLLALLLWERRRWPAWVVLGFAALCALTKATNLLVVGVAIVYLGLRAWHNRSTGADAEPRRRRDLLAMGAGLGLVALVLSAVWLRVASGIAIVPTSYDPFKPIFYTDHLDLQHALNSVTLGLTPAKDPTMLAPFFGHDGFLTIATWTNVLLFAGLVIAIVLRRWGSRVGVLGIATLVIAVTFGPILIVNNYVTAHEYYPLPPRYALALFPVFVALLAAAADRRLVRAGVATFATGAVGYSLVQLAGG